jgi:malonate-semialdehyde dehydrogenase (acetylating) / methylmalonate-semialdehyde dehydrogenase
MAIADQSIGIKTVGHWLNGRVAGSNSGRFGVVWNPATGEPQAHLDFASADEVDESVSIAKSAFPAWSAKSLSRRAEIMFKLRDLDDRNRRAIAELLTAEHGKTTFVALGEVAR